MFAVNRCIFAAIRSVLPINNTSTPRLLFSTLLTPKSPSQLLNNPEVTNITNNTTRTVTKFSLQNGKRKTVKAVLKRFYRLNWGGWIRTIAGRHKRIWKKRNRRRWRVQRHVLCNGQQSFLLDKMVNAYWRRPKYYVDDIYQPYHQRDFPLASWKPKPYFPPESKE